MSRQPNDDRSDVKNPNNDAYWHDMANREGSEDDDSDLPHAPRAISAAETAQRDRELSSLDADLGSIRAALDRARVRYQAADRPFAVAEERHRQAEEEWRRVEDGRVFRGEAEALWALAWQARQSTDVPEGADEELLWNGLGTPGARARVTALVNKSAAAWNAAREAEEETYATGDRNLDDVDAQMRDFERRRARANRDWSDEDLEQYERLERAREAAEDRRWAAEHDAKAEVEAAEEALRAAEAAFVEEYAQEAIKGARTAWETALSTWTAACRAFERAQAEWDRAQAGARAAFDAAGRRAEAMDLAFQRRTR